MSETKRAQCWLALWVCWGAAPVYAGDDMSGYWELARIEPILEKTLTLPLASELGTLHADEAGAVERLLEAGEILHSLYEQQKHPEAADSLRRLEALHAREDSVRTRGLLTLYRLFKGPVLTTLDNERVPFLPVADEEPGRNMYPPGTTQAQIDAYIAAHPAAARHLLGERTVVRSATAPWKKRDLDVLADNPVLQVLHPEVRAQIESAPDGGYYAVPYSVAYAGELLKVNALLLDAARLLRERDADFAAYLTLRARDLLSDDYEGGDAAWVTGRFGALNAQIGSYETYDDKLFGVKTFFSLSLLLRDDAETRRVTAALGDLQALEDALPYSRSKRVRTDIPVGVYHVIADFGQSRGGNTATILPNDAAHARKYGRTILLRYNIMTARQGFAVSRARFAAATRPRFHEHLTPDGLFQRTLWHEVGHYLGVDMTADGRELDAALGAWSDLLEEMKADLVSSFAARMLREGGYIDDATVRAMYAAGVRRVLQAVKPRREQPYQTMQLMQMNYFLEHGLLKPDAQLRLGIDYDLYHEVVRALLAEVLAVQGSGDPGRAEAFVERWGGWRDDLHEVLAARIRDALEYRYTLVRYRVLDGG